MKTSPYVLGFSDSHNASACLLRGSDIVAAVQEERLTRRKRARFPSTGESLAVRYCLAAAEIQASELALVVGATKGQTITDSERLRLALPGVSEDRMVFVPHYLAHAWGAVSMAGFSDAAVLVVDGLGEGVESLERDHPAELVGAKHAILPPRGEPSVIGEIAGIYRVEGQRIHMVEKHLGCSVFSVPGQRCRGFGSLGGMFEAAAELIFGQGLEAGKVMGLAPYGDAVFDPSAFFSITDDGRFSFSNDIPAHYSRFTRGWPSHQREFSALARGLQDALEVGLGFLWERTAELTGADRLAYAGGVALNSVANQKLMLRGRFSDHFVLPPAEDSGLALGAAFAGLSLLQEPRARPRMTRDSLGITYSDEHVLAAVEAAPFVEVADTESPVSYAVDALIRGEIIGLFEGGSELGPRALGRRSILCDPRRPDAKAVLNERVKHRESFRPFAPVVLQEHLHEWFEAEPGESSPFMLRVFRFRPGVRDKVPAVAHIDGTGRVQTVTESDGMLCSLTRLFYQETGVPILLNTSFNVMGEPIVESPEDAVWCSLFSGLDAVVFPRTVCRKRRGFAGLVAHIPVVCADMERLFRDRDGAYWYEVTRRWGRHRAIVSGDAASVLALCGGEASGYEIGAALEKSSGEPWSEVRLLRAFSMLQRTGIITFRE